MTPTTTTTLARMFGARTPSTPFLTSFSRSFSTTPARLDPPRQTGQSWPPARGAAAPTDAASSSETSSSSAAAAASASDSNPLKDMYSSDSPAQWATWSSNDFQTRNNLGGLNGIGAGVGGSGADSGLAATSSRSSVNGGTRIFLGPRTGRTVHVGGRIDASQAFALVGVMCYRNNVSGDFQKQKWHERPGLRRKRVRVQSRAAVYKRNKRATVERVQKLVRMGW
ncbi:hypothetical protein Sste5344_007711 [Sporothrix stenoceras]